MSVTGILASGPREQAVTSTHNPSANGPRKPARASAPAPSAGPRARQRHLPGGATLGKDNTRDAQRTAAAILEVLAGARTPGQAAEALSVSLPRYFQLETRALRAVLESCEPRPRGPGRSADKELAALTRQHERLRSELTRQQTLVRMAQRTIGLAAPAPPPKPAPGKKKRRRPVVRALRAVAHLQQQSEKAPAAESPGVHDEPG
jgi:hypothetical protein